MGSEMCIRDRASTAPYRELSGTWTGTKPSNPRGSREPVAKAGRQARPGSFRRRNPNRLSYPPGSGSAHPRPRPASPLARGWYRMSLITDIIDSEQEALSSALPESFLVTSEPTAGYAALAAGKNAAIITCLLYTSPSPRDGLLSRMPSSA